MTTSEVLIAYNNRVDVTTLIGGNWTTQMPLSNLKDRQLGIKARSADLDPMSTQFKIAMPAENPIRVVALANHNLSLTAVYRIRYGNNPSFDTYDYDSGWLDVWPPVYNTIDLDWQSTNWWSGRYLETERNGYIWTLTHLLPAVARPLWYNIELYDPLNANGFVDLGRLFIAGAWQPALNMAFGATLSWEDSTVVDEALSGQEFFDGRTLYRVSNFTTDAMTEDEGMTQAFEIQRLSGISKEVLFMWDPTDTIHALRRRFLGRLRKLSPIEFPQAYIKGKQLNKTGWEVKESIG